MSFRLSLFLVAWLALSGSALTNAGTQVVVDAPPNHSGLLCRFTIHDKQETDVILEIAKVIYEVDRSVPYSIKRQGVRIGRMATHTCLHRHILSSVRTFAAITTFTIPSYRDEHPDLIESKTAVCYVRMELVHFCQLDLSRVLPPSTRDR